MAVRTTAEAVGGIIEVAATISLIPFIEVANALVTEHCSTDDYDATRLELIERWLSAHFVAQRDVRISREKAGPVDLSYESVVALGFDNTRYGQMAMRLDSAGGLSALNEQAKQGAKITAGISWLGTDLEDEEEE
jgi:hypothetical protein